MVKVMPDAPTMPFIASASSGETSRYSRSGSRTRWPALSSYSATRVAIVWVPLLSWANSYVTLRDLPAQRLENQRTVVRRTRYPVGPLIK